MAKPRGRAAGNGYARVHPPMGLIFIAMAIAAIVGGIAIIVYTRRGDALYWT